jgi:C4-dicarboxylate transporter DctM subunit
MGDIVKGEIPFFIGYVAVYLAVVLFPKVTTLFL